MTNIEEQTPTVAPNTLGEVLSMRYPVVWVNDVDAIETITKIKEYISLYGDLNFYLFNVINGMQRYNYHTERFDTVLKIVITMTGEKAQVPITKLHDAIDHLQDEPCSTLVVVNAEQFQDGLNDLFTFFSFDWRQSFRENSTANQPCQLIFTSSTEPAPPEAVRAYVPTVGMGLPSKEELLTIGMYVKEHTKADFDIDEIATASRGLSVFECIDIYNSMIARTGTIAKREIEDMLFKRLASRAGLDIIRPSRTLDEV
ncbi:MAG: hypothetical protein ACWGQW_04530, partial [bacterium]